MVRIRYRLTAEDFAELEAVRRGGPIKRILRILAGSFLGLLGLALVWQACFFWSRHLWPANLTVASMGLVLLWVGIDAPGLTWLLHRLSDPHAQREIDVYEGKLAWSSGNRSHESAWIPERGFQENARFFFLQAFGSDARLAVPKRALDSDQERSLRAFVQQPSADSHPVECRFFLTQEELDEASASQGRVHRWLNTKYGRVSARVICGLAVLALIWLPRYLGESWSEEFRAEPGVTAGLAGFGLLWFWCAMGCVGLKKLNRLDLERRIKVSDLAVEVTRGSKTSTYKWKRFFSFQETPNLLILRQRTMVQCWIIPKSALSPGEQERLRSLLNRKLPNHALLGWS